MYPQEDLSWPPWIQHTTHLSNLLLVVSTATSFYIYLLKHHARTETEAPRPQHLYLAGQHQHSYRFQRGESPGWGLLHDCEILKNLRLKL